MYIKILPTTLYLLFIEYQILNQYLTFFMYLMN